MNKIPLLILVSIFAVLVTGCVTPQPPASEEPPADQGSGEQCADYERDGVLETYCATCGNNICEPFEKCTSSSCTVEACTRDCGQLYCPQDCETAKEEQEVKLPPNLLPEITASLRTCNKDEDCVKVDADCCGCTAGGQAAALNQETEKVWQQTLDVKCKDIVCPTVMSNHWSCFIQPTCVKNKCTLVNE